MKETIERSDRKELELLRISLARIAQALNVGSIILPVERCTDIASLSKLAREQNRGWNNLAGSIISRLEIMGHNNAYAIRNITQIVIDWLSDGKHNLDDIERLLMCISPIVPQPGRLYYTRAASNLNEGGEAILEAKTHLKCLLDEAELATKG